MEDKEVKKLIKTQKQEKYLRILLAMSEIEERENIDIKKFSYDEGLITIYLGNDNYIRHYIFDDEDEKTFEKDLLC